MKWDQQTLDTYLEKTSQKDEDALILQKYARQDESKIKELTLKNQALHENMIRNRKALDSERTEGIAAQVGRGQVDGACDGHMTLTISFLYVMVD